MDTSTSVDILATLTDAQQQAVTHLDGPLLILAGPGSGKTRVVTHRIAWMLQQGVYSRQIVALTFTNKAADEMRRRLNLLVPRQNVWMGTFHRFCSRLLRMHAPLVGLKENFTIFDTDDSLACLKQAVEASNQELTHTTPDAIARAISWAKNNLMTPEQFAPQRGSHVGYIAAQLYPLYQQRLLASNAVDFDDLLLHVATLLRENPELRSSLDERYRYILVDEYQDTNLAQYAIVRALSQDHANLAATGDPDQSIYGWRGANLNNILDFERDFKNVKVVRLEQNYRSTKRILRVADELIRHNIWRKDKRLWTENEEGQKVRLITYPTQRDEAEDIAHRMAQAIHEGKRRPRDFAIFYRTNALSRQLEHSLRDVGVPYQIVNGLEFYQRKEIKDVLAYLQLINNPANDVALLRIINTPTRGIGKATILKLQAHAQRYKIPILDAAREAGLIPDLPKKAAVGVAKFVAMIELLRNLIHEPVEELIGRVLSESGLREVLENSDNEEDQERLANLEELLTAAREFDEQHPEDGGLERFLEDSSLASDTDAFEGETDKATLMTLHAAKGLEFPVVYLIAVEQGLLPHERSKDDEKKIEEERRLLFVGITRARQELQLSYAEYRAFRGRTWPTVPSPFLMELPRAEMHTNETFAGRRVSARLEQGEFGHAVDAPSDGEIHEAPDEDFSQEPAAAGGKSLARLKTAAEMFDETAQAKPRPNKYPPELFHHGMIVDHPEYGPGEIIALSGRGFKRTATVRFYGGQGEKKFLLAHSPLKPAEA
jgi:DNA helicase-2/ATP-dependent DNA helicase PcrA